MTSRTTPRGMAFHAPFRRWNPSSVLDFPDPQVAKLDPVGVALQPDFAGGTLESRVFLGDFLVLEAFIEVGIDNLLAVEDHANVPFLRPDFHRVPFPRRVAGE